METITSVPSLESVLLCAVPLDFRQVFPPDLAQFTIFDPWACFFTGCSLVLIKDLLPGPLSGHIRLI